MSEHARVDQIRRGADRDVPERGAAGNAVEQGDGGAGRHDEADHELDDLKPRDVLGRGPAHVDLERLEGEVRVHDGVDDEVHADHPPPGGERERVAVAGADEGRRVVEPVDERQGTLAEDDEQGVAQLDHLGDDERPRPELGRLVAELVARVADGAHQAALDEGADELRDHLEGARDAEEGEAGVPGEEGRPQVERLALPHEGLDGVHGGDVEDAGVDRQVPVGFHPPHVVHGEKVSLKAKHFEEALWFFECATNQILQ